MLAALSCTMRTTSITLLAGLWSALLLIPREASAQAIRAPLIERRARVTWTEGDYRPQQVGAVVLTADTLRLRTAAGAIIPIATKDIVRFEVSTGRRRHWWQGGLVGLGIGAIIGAVAGNDTHQTCQREGGNACFFVSDRQSNNVLTGMAIVGVPGFVIGTGIGALVRSDEWADSTALVRPKR